MVADRDIEVIEVIEDLDWVDELGGQYWIYRCVDPSGRPFILVREHSIPLLEAAELLREELRKHAP
jgi:hypothetical protein